MTENNKVELLVALGAVTQEWSKFEFALFELFDALLGARTYKARILWFNLSNLQMRLKLLKSIADESRSEHNMLDQIKASLRAADELSGPRNDYVHRLWSRGQDGWQMIALKDPSKPTYVTPVRVEEILLIAKKISEQSVGVAILASKVRATVARFD